MKREEIFEMIEDTQVANLIINWHEAETEIEQNEIFNFLYHQEGMSIEDLKSVGLLWNF